MEHHGMTPDHIVETRPYLDHLKWTIRKSLFIVLISDFYIELFNYVTRLKKNKAHKSLVFPVFKFFA